MNSRYLIDKITGRIWFLLAVTSILILVLITYFLLEKGAAAFFNEGLGSFLFGTEWKPYAEDGAKFGAGILILGSIFVTLGVLIFAGPLSIACAIFLSEVAPAQVSRILRPAIDLLVGIPSVVYGLVGMLFLVPFIRDNFGGNGYSIIAAVIVMTIMVLPTMVSLTEDSLRTLPRQYKESSLALGATHWQTIWRVMLPAARSGIASALILGMGRAIGEAMACYMVLGNAWMIPNSPFDSTRTLTSNIVGQINEAPAGSFQEALFATGIILLVFILLFNTIGFAIRRGDLRK